MYSEQLKWAVVVILVLVILYLFLHKSPIYEGNMKEHFLGLWQTRSRSPFDHAYFDYNGTSPMLPEAEKVWRRASRLGNAHAAYATEARQEINRAEQVFLNAVAAGEQGQVIWTSGGSESNNLLLRGVAAALAKNTDDGATPHFILSAVEHKTSLECAQQLLQEGKIELTVLPVMSTTFVCLYTLQRAIRPNTRLVSIMHINNESGAINNLEFYGRVIRDANPNIIFHTDAVQSMGKMPPDMLATGLDAISFSSHKFGGPLGCGGLIIRRSLAEHLQPQICGSQNHGLRGGTDNIPGIAASGRALEISLQNRPAKNGALLTKKLRIIEGLARAFPLGDVRQYLGQSDATELLVPSPDAKGDTRFQLVPLGNPDLERSAPNTLWFSVVRVGPMAQHFCNLRLRDDLQQAGVIISTGSACNQTTDGRAAESHVLNAIQAPYVIRCGVVRVSFGDSTSNADCDRLVRELIRGIKAQA